MILNPIGSGEPRGDLGAASGPFPVWLWLPATLGAALLVLPLAALLLRLDWSGVPAAITSPAALQALGLSLTTAAWATLV
ncbi:MAG: hypothetical protein ACRDT9_13740, partial [Agromyces sp.]